MKRPESVGRRHGLAAVLAAAVSLAALGYAGFAASAVGAVAAKRSSALLGARTPGTRDALAELGDGRVRAALSAEPLSQRVVNVAAVRAVDGGASPAPWMAQVGRLGWLDTRSLQNQLGMAAQAQDLQGILDAGEGLLRRQQLVEQVVPLISVVELDAGQRRRMVQRLAARPNWRAPYLTNTGHLRAPEQLEARYELARALASRGGLDRLEAVYNVGVLAAGGRYDLAFSLWQAAQPGVTSPLNDQRFARAAASTRGSEDAALLFEWEPLTGEGFNAGVYDEGGAGRLEIDWDGRGVPVFARQRTSAVPGSYALTARVADGGAADLAVLAFSLACDSPGPTVVLQPVAGSPGLFRTERPVPCSYPVLQIAGTLRSSAAGHRIAFDALELRPLRAGE